ncbi:DUF6177 family protein [Streptomyces achromogenes]
MWRSCAPSWAPPPVPVAFTLGARDVRAAGLAHCRRPPLPTGPVPLGSAVAPALHYPLGDGTDPAAWTALKALTEHLRTGGG